MSEERLERIETQLEQVVQVVEVVGVVQVMQQNMTVMQQSIIAMQQSMTVLQQSIIAMQQDMRDMQNRVDSMEGTLLTAMTVGFASLRNYAIDLDTDLAENERKSEDNARKTRRLNQRLMHLEQRNNNAF